MPQMGAVEFASVLAAAAPFGDRLRGRYFAPTGEPDPAVLAAWARAAGADRTDLLDAALVLLGLTQAQLAAGLAPVRLRGAESLVATAGMATIPEELLPSWGLALRDFLHAVGSAPLDGWHVPVGPIFTDVWVRACSAASFSARRVRSASACAFQSLSTWRLGAGPSDGCWRVGSVMVVLSGSREV